MEIKNKNFFQYIIVVAIICFGLLSSAHAVLAATISLVPGTAKYKVGDTIKIRAVIGSDVPVNAVSAKVSFPTNILSLTSISKSFSIVNLWVKDPSYSNESGLATFEGVILEGFKGNSGNVVTMSFKAKSEGRAELKFSGVSILANDGKGSELYSGSYASAITIVKADVIEEKPVEKPSVVENIIDTTKEAFVEVRKVEETSNLPDYSLVILLSLIIILVLILIVMYGIFYITKIKKYIRRKLIATEDEVSKDFKVLEKDLDKEIIISRKMKENEKLTDDEMASLVNFRKDIENTEEVILEDIKDIEKNS